MAKVRNELEHERSKRTDAEQSIRSDSHLKQAYDRLSANMKS